MTIQAGDTILNGKYHVLRLIGEGGMARVWLAEELLFGGRRVALKEMRADLPQQEAEEVRQRYQREVQICAALVQASVPNIVRALTAEPFEGQVLLSLTYLPGGDLAGLLSGRPGGLAVDRVVAIASSLLEALEGLHLHPLEVVHRDIKPSNVLFDAAGVAHLGDFGVAQVAGTSGRTHLVAGAHPGTPLYMAPEQASSPQPVGPAADVYALGCVLFEVLTGRRYKRVRPGTRASSLRPEVPGWLDEALARALLEDPWDRWQSAEEMAQAFEGRPAQAPAAPMPAAVTAVEDQRTRLRTAATPAPVPASPPVPSGMLPVAQHSIPSPPPSGSSVVLPPYQLSEGCIAAAPADLVTICDADWERAVEHFYRGFIAGWLRKGVSQLREAFQHGLAEELEQAANQAEIVLERARDGDAIDRGAGLEEFLEFLGAEPPVLALAPTELDLGAVGQAEPGEPLLLALTNRGRGFLSGRVAVDVAWLQASPVRFGLTPGQCCTVTLTPSLEGMTPGRFRVIEAVTVHSNGGRQVAELRVDVVAAVLSVDGDELDLGTIDLGQHDATRQAKFALRNAGAGFLLGLTETSVDWLSAEPTVLRCEAGESQEVIVSACPSPSLFPGMQCQAVHVHSNAGTASVPVKMRVRLASLEPEMVHVPAGEFLMGSSKNDWRLLQRANPEVKHYLSEAFENEKPQHKVFLGEYWIGRYPVTNAQYVPFVAAGNRAPSGWDWVLAHPEVGNHPVHGVLWADAVAYCSWLAAVTGRSYRLPTEAEWEKAARGTDGRLYPWGNTWDPAKCSNRVHTRRNSTTPTGAFSPAGDSPYGCADMAGNVWEWFADWWDPDYYAKSPYRNPPGPNTGAERVLRGGSWVAEGWVTRCAFRLGFSVVIPEANAGIRCAAGPSVSR